MNVSINQSLVEFEENPLVFSTLKAIFELTNKQLDCFLTLRIKKNAGSCIKNLVDSTNSERSIIQKHLKVLLEKGLVIRESVSLSEFNIRCQKHDIENQIKTNKGYLYIYASISDEELLAKIYKTLEDWKNILKAYLSNN